MDADALEPLNVGAGRGYTNDAVARFGERLQLGTEEEPQAHVRGRDVCDQRLRHRTRRVSGDQSQLPRYFAEWNS